MLVEWDCWSGERGGEAVREGGEGGEGCTWGMRQLVEA